MLWHRDHARKLSRATDRQMIEKPTHSSRAGLSCKKADFGEMQKMLQFQAGLTPGLWFVSARVALSPKTQVLGRAQGRTSHSISWEERAHG